ncbi:hypothetical protein CRM22_002299 [Opisthorchis felineus]|uniref:Uncharacterized protein n=1 Tax=Opisthorchis felineus TaxID=147828 RepID=A0A4S2MD33_OPIFE|nr:hypothetical protein CRM22_002299 [Opisthorchis felineus]
MFNRSQSTFVGGLRDMSAEAVVCSTFGIQPGIVKQAKEKFASDTESSSYNVFNKVARSSHGFSANASLKSEYDFALRGVSRSGGKYSESGLVFRRPPLLGGESWLEKSYFSEGSIHNIREINGRVPQSSNTLPGTRNLGDNTRRISKGKEPNFKESLLSTQMISTNDSYANALNGHNHIDLNNGNRVFGTVGAFDAERTDPESRTRFPPSAKPPVGCISVSTGRDNFLAESPANGTFENLKSEKTANFQPYVSNSLGDEVPKKHLPLTHMTHMPFSYIHPNEVATQRGLIHQRHVAAPCEVARSPASDATKLAVISSSREMPTILNKLFPPSADTRYEKSECTLQQSSREYIPVHNVQHNPALMNLSPCKPWYKWSGHGKPVALGAEASDSYLNSNLQSSAKMAIKSQYREQKHTEKGQPLSRHSSPLILNVFTNPAYAVSLSTQNDVPKKSEPPGRRTLENDARKSVNNTQQNLIGTVQGEAARRSKSFVMHRSNTIALSKADSYSESKREKSARVLETSRFPQTCWWTYPYLSNRHYGYPSQKDVHSGGYNERISESNADEPKDTIILQETMKKIKEYVSECKESHSTRDVVPDKAHLTEDENSSQLPKPLRAPSLRSHNAEEHVFGISCQEKTLVNGGFNKNVLQLFDERKNPPSATFDDQKIISSRAEKRNTQQNHNTFEKITSPMDKTYQGDVKTHNVRQSNSLERQPRFLGLPSREWVPQSHSENPIRRPILRSNSQPQAVAANKKIGLVEATTRKPSREMLSGTIPKAPFLEIPDVLDSPEYQKGDLEHCNPLNSNRTTKRRTLSMPSSNRNSSISQRPEYTMLAQKLEEQFRAATSWIKPKTTTTPLSDSKSDDRDPEPSNGTPVVEKCKDKAETAPPARPSHSWPQSGSTAGKTIQPMQRQLMMELAEILAKRTENVDPPQLSSPPPKTESNKTKQGNIPPPTSPEVAAVVSEVKPDKPLALPKPFAPMNSTLEANETAGCRDAPPKFRPGLATNESPVGMFNSAPLPSANLVLMQNDKVGNTNGTVGFPEAPPNFRPGVTTKEQSVGMSKPAPFPSNNPVQAHNDKIELETSHVETREPVPVLTPPSKAPSMPVFGQISDSDQLTNSNVQRGPIHGDAKISDSISKDLSKPTPRPRVLFPPDDKLITTHDYEVDSRISSPSQSAKDFSGFMRGNDLRMYKSNIEDTSDTASNCSATIEPLRRSRKQYPRPRIHFAGPIQYNDCPWQFLRPISRSQGPPPSFWAQNRIKYHRTFKDTRQLSYPKNAVLHLKDQTQHPLHHIQRSNQLRLQTYQNIHGNRIH